MNAAKIDYSDLIGKPFADCGRGPDAYDCWGGIIAAAAKHGLHIPDYGEFHHEDGNGILGRFRQVLPEWQEISRREKPQVLDVILFKRLDGSLHFGIVIDKRCFLHVTRALGCHISKLSHPVYRHLIQAFYRIKR